MQTPRTDEVWKNTTLAHAFLDGVRGGIPLAAEQIDVMLRLIAACGRPVIRIADLGCGGGTLARAILTRYPAAQCTLVDFSEPMLAVARRELAQQQPPAHFVSADLAAPDWVRAVEADAPFDAVVSGFAIHHLADERKRELYAEILPLLALGGIFVNMEHVASATPWFGAIADAVLIDSLHAFHVRDGGRKTRAEIADEFVHRPDKAANILAPVDTQCAWLRQCGFVDVDCSFKIFELAVFSGRRPAGD